MSGHRRQLLHLMSPGVVFIDAECMCAQARRRGHPVGSPVFTVVFRPAALDKLDGDMVNVNIPAIPDKAEDQNPTVYYFGKIRQARGPLATPSVWSATL